MLICLLLLCYGRCAGGGEGGGEEKRTREFIPEGVVSWRVTACSFPRVCLILKWYFSFRYSVSNNILRALARRDRGLPPPPHCILSRRSCVCRFSSLPLENRTHRVANTPCANSDPYAATSPPIEHWHGKPSVSVQVKPILPRNTARRSASRRY